MGFFDIAKSVVKAGADYHNSKRNEYKSKTDDQLFDILSKRSDVYVYAELIGRGYKKDQLSAYGDIRNLDRQMRDL